MYSRFFRLHENPAFETWMFVVDHIFTDFEQLRTQVQVLTCWDPSQSSYWMLLIERRYLPAKPEANPVRKRSNLTRGRALEQNLMLKNLLRTEHKSCRIATRNISSDKCSGEESIGMTKICI